MSGEVHVFDTASQPATRWAFKVGGKMLWMRSPRNRLYWAGCCRKRRPAKNLRVKAYYDETLYFCAKGKGCKKP